MESRRHAEDTASESRLLEVVRPKKVLKNQSKTPQADGYIKRDAEGPHPTPSVRGTPFLRGL